MQVFNLYGCPLRCMGINRPPESTITRLADNTWQLRGTGNKVFRFIEKHMNFTARIALFQKTDQKKGYKVNNPSLLYTKDRFTRSYGILFEYSNELSKSVLRQFTILSI